MEVTGLGPLSLKRTWVAGFRFITPTEGRGGSKILHAVLSGLGFDLFQSNL